MNLPLPPGDESSNTATEPLVVAVVSGSGVLGTNPGEPSPPTGPVCAAKEIDDPLTGLGNDATKSNSRHFGVVPKGCPASVGQVATKSSGNVCELRPQLLVLTARLLGGLVGLQH